jgi:putative transposase
MGISRSSFYDQPTVAHDDTAIVEAMAATCDEFEFYGRRRRRAELRHRGMIGNHKKSRRLMRKHDLQPRCRRRYVATTDSDDDQPIYSQSNQRVDNRRAQPALGRGHNVCRHHRGLCLRRGDP